MGLSEGTVVSWALQGASSGVCGGHLRSFQGTGESDVRELLYGGCQRV